MVDETRSEEKKNGRKHPVRVAFKIVLNVVTWLVIAIGAVLIGAALWIRRTFGPISVDQMLMNLPGNGETTNAEAGYVSAFVWQVLVYPLAIVVLVGLFVIGYRALRRLPAGARPSLARKIGDRIATASRVLGVPYWGKPLASLGVLAIGALLCVQTINLNQYIQAATTSLSMSAYYSTPVVSRMPEQKQNLVVIYLESMENAFSDDEMFEENMLEPLEDATKDWDQIDSLRQYDGGGWTMAGIVGTQCGVPLRGTQTAQAGQLDLIGSGSDAYLPGATCLGDVLADKGYTNVFMGGADASFASKRLYLESHGYDEVYDLNTWVERGDTELSGWGLSDRALMQHARDEIDLLHASDQPFNLTMLTLDTHDPAYAFDYCPITTEVAMTSITRCSMEQVAEFVDYMEQQGYLEDTTVVLMGDHERFISAGSDYQQLLDLEDRTIFNRIWSPNSIKIEREDADQLSMEATILDLLGIELEGYRAGIGASALASKIGAGSLFELDPELQAEVVRSRSSDLYSQMWGLADESLESADYFDPKNPPADVSGQNVQPKNLTE